MKTDMPMKENSIFPGSKWVPLGKYAHVFFPIRPVFLFSRSCSLLFSKVASEVKDKGALSTPGETGGAPCLLVVPHSLAASE